MIALLKEIRHNPMLWPLFFVPVVIVAGKVWPEAHTLLFVLSVLAIVPPRRRGYDTYRHSHRLAPNSGPVGGFVDVLVLMVCLIFALTLCLLPPVARRHLFWEDIGGIKTRTEGKSASGRNQTLGAGDDVLAASMGTTILMIKFRPKG